MDSITSPFYLLCEQICFLTKEIKPFEGTFFVVLLGLDDRENLPGFYYRDDALDLWKIMENFVRNLLGCYYKSNEVSKNAQSRTQLFCQI